MVPSMPELRAVLPPINGPRSGLLFGRVLGQAHPTTPEANRGYQRTSRVLEKRRQLEGMDKAINSVYERLTKQKL